MADEAELDAMLARLEAAMSVITVPEAGPDLSGELDATRAAVAEAAKRTDALEAELQAARDALAEAQVAPVEAPASPSDAQEAQRMRAALEALTVQMDTLRDGAGDVDESLRAEVEALRAARALDLAEMKALLNDLEPLLEPANA